MLQNKFSDQFIEFMKDTDNDYTKNYFIIFQQDGSVVLLNNNKRKRFIYNLVQYIYFFLLVIRSKNIILHGIFSLKANIFLLMSPVIKQRVSWAVIGADLHDEYYNTSDIISKFRSIVKKRCAMRATHILTVFRSDVIKAEEKYNTMFVHVPCLTYPSNMLIVRDELIERTRVEVSDQLTIMAGNSADKTNKHIDLFNLINSKIRADKFQITCPISYGGTRRSKEFIRNHGTHLFFDKINFWEQFIPYDDYLTAIMDFDVFIFYHERPQALGTIIQCLGAGKTLYLNSKSPVNDFLTENGFSFFRLDECEEIEILSEKIRYDNACLAHELFTPENTFQIIKTILD